MKDTIGRGIRKVFTEQQKRKIGNFLSTFKKSGIFVLWYCVVATRALLGKNCIQNEYFCDF